MTGPSPELPAPAKINWTLEVLGKRPDGYHDVRTILQSIALSDSLAIRPADGLSLDVSGEAGPLAAEQPDTNLAYRAAARLQREAGRPLGARIELRKGTPVAAGLGGGSSDAAAVLRGLRDLWGVPISDDELALIAADLGSDVPFFLLGGTVLAAGKGDALASLPDVAPQRLVVAWPERGGQTDKTARMYAALRPDQHTDGSRTERLAARLRRGTPVHEEDLYNVFEQVLRDVDPEAAETLERAAALGVGRPHLAGSGPAFFFLLAPERPVEPVLHALERLGLRPTETHTLSAAEAVPSAERP